jgi:S1-C subfamily serine protease
VELFQRLVPAVPLVSATGGLPGAGPLATGSGFLVEKGGKMLVITNLHVIFQAGEWVGITFYRANSSVRLLSTNARTADCLAHQTVDLAAIPLNEGPEDLRPKGIRPLPLAPEDLELKQGQETFAVGHPGGGVFTATATKGMISGLERRIPETEGSFIQIQANINPGNSGGPLVDSRGRVLGVITWKYVAGEGISGALYARYVRELLAGTSVPFLKKREEVLGPVMAQWRSDQKRLAATERALQALGLTGLGDGRDLLGIVLCPAQETAFPFELAAGRSYGIWVLTFDVETNTLAELERIEFESDGGARFEAKPIPAGSLYLVTAEQAIRSKVRLRNSGARLLQVALIVLVK